MWALSGFHERAFLKMDLLDQQYHFLFVVSIKLRYGWIIIIRFVPDVVGNQSQSTRPIFNFFFYFSKKKGAKSSIITRFENNWFIMS